MQYSQAKDIAINIWDAMRPDCDIVKVAGSIRRQKPEVKDIEIVALPKMIMGKDLFGGDTEKVRNEDFKKLVLGFGEVVKGKVDGKYMQIHMSEPGINVDLFMPDDFDYFRQLVIRTGSADWVSRFVAGGWRNVGWVGSDAGLRLKIQCEGTEGPDGKTKWKCIVPKNEQTLPPHWKSEKEFFDFIKLKWVEPKLRNI